MILPSLIVDYTFHHDLSSYLTQADLLFYDFQFPVIHLLKGSVKFYSRLDKHE